MAAVSERAVKALRMAMSSENVGEILPALNLAKKEFMNFDWEIFSAEDYEAETSRRFAALLATTQTGKSLADYADEVLALNKEILSLKRENEKLAKKNAGLIESLQRKHAKADGKPVEGLVRTIKKPVDKIMTKSVIPPVYEGERLFVSDVRDETLTNTKIQKCFIDGVLIDGEATTWNKLQETILRAMLKRDTIKNLERNWSGLQLGKNNNYKYLPDIDVTIRNKGSLEAWKSFKKLALAYNMTIEIHFVWVGIGGYQPENTLGKIKT